METPAELDCGAGRHNYCHALSPTLRKLGPDSSAEVLRCEETLPDFPLRKVPLRVSRPTFLRSKNPRLPQRGIEERRAPLPPQ